MNSWKQIIENKQFLKAISLMSLIVCVVLIGFTLSSFYSYQEQRNKISTQEGTIAQLMQNAQNVGVSHEKQNLKQENLDALGAFGAGLVKQNGQLLKDYSLAQDQKNKVLQELANLSAGIRQSEKNGMKMDQIGLASQFVLLTHQAILTGRTDANMVAQLNQILLQFSRSSPEVFANLGENMNLAAIATQNYVMAQMQFVQSKEQMIKALSLAQGMMVQSRSNTDQNAQTAMVAMMALFGVILAGLSGIFWYVFHRHNFEFLGAQSSREAKETEKVLVSQTVDKLLEDVDRTWVDTQKERALIEAMNVQVNALSEIVHDFDRNFHAQYHHDMDLAEDMVYRLKNILTSPELDPKLLVQVKDALTVAQQMNQDVSTQNEELDAEVISMEQTLENLDGKILDLRLNTQTLIADAKKVQKDRSEFVTVT